MELSLTQQQLKTSILAALKTFENKGIQKDSSKQAFQSVLDYQDLIGRSTSSNLQDVWQGFDALQRRSFLWANLNCLDQETALDILKKTHVNEWVQKEQTEMFSRWHAADNKLRARERTIEEGKKTIWKKIRDLKNTILNQKDKIAWLNNHRQQLLRENTMLSNRNAKLEKAGAILDQIKNFTN